MEITSGECGNMEKTSDECGNMEKTSDDRWNMEKTSDECGKMEITSDEYWNIKNSGECGNVQLLRLQISFFFNSVHLLCIPKMKNMKNFHYFDIYTIGFSAF